MKRLADFKSIDLVNYSDITSIIEVIRSYGFNCDVFKSEFEKLDFVVLAVDDCIYRLSFDECFDECLAILETLEQFDNDKDNRSRKIRDKVIDYLSKMEDETNYSFTVSLFKR